MLQELRADLDDAHLRIAIRERLREYGEGSLAGRSAVDRADCAWRVVQNVLAEELAELNAGLDAEDQIKERDRLALPDGGQAIDLVYRGYQISIVRSKDRRSLALIDASAGRLPIEHVGSKLFIAGEPIARALLVALVRLIERATAGVFSQSSAQRHYMAMELPTFNAAKVEAALNLAVENGFRFVESYAGTARDRRVFLFKRAEK